MKNNVVFYSPKSIFVYVFALFIACIASACTVGEFDANEGDWPCNSASDCISGYTCDEESSWRCVPLTIPPCEDLDGDGVSAGDSCVGALETFDCDDQDPNNKPGGEEVCDGRDNNCNDEIDENIAPIACPLNGHGVCAEVMPAPTYECVDGVQDVNTCTVGCEEFGSAECPYGPFFAAEETEINNLCADMMDNDCDGAADEERMDGGACPTCVDGEACMGDGCFFPDEIVETEANCRCAGVGVMDCSGGGEEVCRRSSDDAVILEPYSIEETDSTSTPEVDDNCDGVIE